MTCIRAIVKYTSQKQRSDMMFTINRWRLAVAVMGFLFVMVLPSMTIFSPIAHAQPAKLGPISIQSVWTSNGQQNSKTTFAPVDWIYYHVDFDNNTGGQVKVTVQEEVIR
jgi:hypothetical protein